MSPGLAWICYVPLPGVALIPVLVEPRDAHTRYHAWQGTAWTLLAWVVLVAVAVVASWTQAIRPLFLAFAFLEGALVLAAVAGVGCGITTAAMGRFGRVRPAWDLLVALRR